MTYKAEYLSVVGDTYGRGKPLPQYDVLGRKGFGPFYFQNLKTLFKKTVNY